MWANLVSIETNLFYMWVKLFYLRDFLSKQCFFLLFPWQLRTTVRSGLKYLQVNSRRRHRNCSIKKGVRKIFAKFTGKHLCQSLFFHKVAGLRPATVSIKRLWHRWFPVNFAKFLRTSFLQSTSGRLLQQFAKLFSKRSVY